jgi:hypothetical protein
METGQINFFYRFLLARGLEQCVNLYDFRGQVVFEIVKIKYCELITNVLRSGVIQALMSHTEY